jgi:hypothetical protein
MCCCFSYFVNKLSDYLIRPKRKNYNIRKLDCDLVEDCQVIRKDFELYNLRKEKLCCSLFAPAEIDFANNNFPCVIYCHTNQGFLIFFLLF